MRCGFKVEILHNAVVYHKGRSTMGDVRIKYGKISNRRFQEFSDNLQVGDL